MKISCEFKSDREMTVKEISNLLSSLYLQIQEPCDLNGDDETFSTSEIFVRLDSVK